MLCHFGGSLSRIHQVRGTLVKLIDTCKSSDANLVLENRGFVNNATKSHINTTSFASAREPEESQKNNKTSLDQRQFVTLYLFSTLLAMTWSEISK